MTEDRTTYKPKFGEGQVTINTPLNNVPHNHPRKMQHHIDRFKTMNDKIGKCLDRVVSNSHYGTVLKVDDETWMIKLKDTGPTI